MCAGAPAGGRRYGLRQAREDGRGVARGGGTRGGASFSTEAQGAAWVGAAMACASVIIFAAAVRPGAGSARMALHASCGPCQAGVARRISAVRTWDALTSGVAAAGRPRQLTRRDVKERQDGDVKGLLIPSEGWELGAS